MRNAQKNPHIAAIGVAKKISRCKGLAVHRTTIQHSLHNKDLHGRIAYDLSYDLNTKYLKDEK